MINLAYVGCQTPEIFEIDLRNRIISRTFSVTGSSTGSGRIAINSDGSRIYRPTDDGRLNIVDVETGTEISVISLGGSAAGRFVELHPTNTLAYIAREDCTVSVVSTLTHSVVATLDASVTGPGDKPYGFAISPDGTLLYVSVWDDDLLGYVNYVSTSGGSTGVITMTDYFPNNPSEGDDSTRPWALNVSPDGSLLYITTDGARINGTDHSVMFIANGGAAEAQYVLDNEVIQGFSVNYSPDASVCYITTLSSWINIFDTFSGTEIYRKPLHAFGDDLAVSADGSILCVAEHLAVPDSVEIIDVATMTTLGFVLLPVESAIGSVVMVNENLFWPGPHMLGAGLSDPRCP